MFRLICVFIVVFAALAQPPLPQWPPAEEFRVSIKYNPGLYDVRIFDLTGVYFFSAKLNRYAIDARDPYRTLEKAFFQEDTKTQYILSKFGEFAWSCKTYKNDEFTQGPISYIPPFGLDGSWLKKSEYKGQIDCGANKCDIYELDTGKKIITALFLADGQRQLVQIEETISGQTIRKAEFSDFVVGPQSKDLFIPPAIAKCK
jgi:hypothetical protein